MSNTFIPVERVRTTTLDLTDVSVRFGGLVALDGVSMSTLAGEIVGVIGPNGAGKTTLLNVITGIIRPNHGTVSVGGINCTRWTVHRRARLGLARTFQRVTLYPELSLRDHLRLSVEARYPIWRNSSRQSEDVAEKSLEVLRQFGWDATGRESVAGLPLGRARLVELAMSFSAEPKVLLLDEPLSGLAGAERQAIAVALREMRETSSVTVLVVEHDLESVSRIADRLVVLDFGKKISDGLVDQVLSDEVVRSAYFGAGRR
jgi:branched-chain amino acid transport system ATP-binding protein